MKEWFRKIRYKLAYLIAPDWIDDLESRLSAILCEATGGRLSKCYYPMSVMFDEIHAERMRYREDCEAYKVWSQEPDEKKD